MPDDFDIENYTKEVFFMFSGEKVLVDLRCDNSLMKTMVDCFGEDVTTLAYDMTSFRVQTEVSGSQYIACAKKLAYWLSYCRGRTRRRRTLRIWLENNKKDF